jgi:hypothetical protein
MRALILSLGLAVSASTLVTAAGCDKGKPTVQLDLEKFGKDLDKRESEVATNPKVSAAMNEMMTALGKDPGLMLSGGKLFAQVSADPKVAAAGQAVIGQLTSSAAIQKVVMQIMSEHPGATPDQIGELVGAKFSAVTESPELAPAFQTAFNAMLAKLHPQQRFDTMIAKTSARLDAYIDAPERVARWSDRLRELNGGSDPGVEKATQLYIDHAWSNDRIEAFMLKVLANPTVRNEAAAMFAEILAQPDLDAKIIEVSGQISADPAMQDGAVQLMQMLISTPIPTADMTNELTKVLTAPVVTTSLDKLIDIVFEDPKIAASVSVHFDKICADPEVKKDFDDLIDHW